MLTRLLPGPLLWEPLLELEPLPELELLESLSEPESLLFVLALPFLCGGAGGISAACLRSGVMCVIVGECMGRSLIPFSDPTKPY